MDNTQNNSVGSNSDAFHRFQWLPAELRRLIWLLHLGEAASSPTIYRFMILHTVSTFPEIEDGAYRQVATAEDDVFLAPMATLKYNYLNDKDHRFYWDNLVCSTRASRAALAACPESRQIALGPLPDTIPFRKLEVTKTRRNLRWTRGSVDINHARSVPEYLLRFNRNRDIIVFDTTWYDEEIMMQLSRLDKENGAAPRPWTKIFSRLRRVGFSMGSFARGAAGARHDDFTHGVERRHCSCGTDECRDSCRLDPLPRFLTSIFPELETFYIAQAASATDDNPMDMYEPWVLLRDADCKCAATTSAEGEDAGETETNQPDRHHVWPSFRSADINRLCACWDERTGCLPPNCLLLDWIRREWRPQFPYYQKLAHLDIRFLRRLDPVGDPGSDFPEWLALV